MDGILIRRATVADYPGLLQFVDAIFSRGNPDEFQNTFPNLYSDAPVATNVAWLACDHDQIVGHVGVHPLRVRARAGTELSIAGVAAVSTHPEYRGRGIMSAMLQAAIKGMEESSYDLSVLWGDRMRYLHFGWEVVGRKVEWLFDARIALAAGFKPIELIPFDPGRHLEALVGSWNSDSAGTLHDRESMRSLLRRDLWHTVVAADTFPGGPLAFATFRPLDERLVIDKLVGPPNLLPGILLGIQNLAEKQPAVITVRCPALPHPVAQLGIEMNSNISVKPVCHARVINARSLAAKLQVQPESLADSRGAVRRLFGTPADYATECHSLWIEEIASV